MDLFDLAAKITLDTSEYEKGLETASNKTSSFGDKLGTAMKIGGAAVGALATGTTALAGAIVGGAGKTAEFGDNIDKMSQKMGISAQAYQEWDAIMQHSGTSIDALKPSMKTLAQQAEKGSAAFQKLGISEEEVGRLSQEDLFARVISGLQDMEEGTERTAITAELLGRGATELGALLNTSAEDTERMRQRVHELGGVMSDEAVKAAAAYQDSLQDMQTAFQGISRSLTADFMPGITTVMDGLAMVFSGDSENGIAMISQGMTDLVANLTEKVPEFIEIGTGIIIAIGEAMVENLPKLIEAGSEAMLTIVDAIIQNLPSIIETGLSIIESVSSGIIQYLPELIPTVVDVVIQIVETLIDNVDMLVDSSIAIIMALADGLINALPRLLEKAPEIVGKLVNAIIQNAPKLLESALQLIVKLAEGIIKNLPKIASTATNIIRTLVNGIGNLMSQVIDIGRRIVEGIWQGIQNMASWFWNQVTGFFKGIVDGVKNALGIHSPSRVFAGIGKQMVAGLGEGWDDSFDKIKNSINDDLDFSSKSASISVSGSASGIKSGSGVYGGIVINVENMNVRNDSDIRQIAKQLYGMINQSARSQGLGGVYA